MATYEITMNPINKSPTGWYDWRWIRTGINIKNIPYGRIPYNYLPANQIQVLSEIAHNYIELPWNFDDAFTSFILPATTGGLMGVLAGTASAAQIMARGSYMSFGLTAPPPHGSAPRFSYCVSNLYKDETYLEIQAWNIPIYGTIFLNKEDLYYRSKYKRMYFLYSEVKSLTIVTDSKGKVVPNILWMDIGLPTSILSSCVKDNTYNDAYKMPVTVDITMKRVIKANEAQNLTLSFIYVNSKAQILVDLGELKQGQYPTSGTFVEFVKPLCLENPYLMDGFWLGSENEGNTSFNSGYDLFATSSVKPCIKGNFTGAYVPVGMVKEKEAISPNVNYGLQMFNSEGLTWYFSPTKNYNKSLVYGNSKDRYMMLETRTYNKKVAVQYDVMANADKTNLVFANIQKTYNQNDFIRLELDIGGNPTHANYHFPCLKNQYIKINGRYYKILDQIDGNVIDVALYGVDATPMKKEDLDAEYTIVNQYSWMINEYFMNDKDQKAFQGITQSVEKVNTNDKSIKQYVVNITVDNPNPSHVTNIGYTPSYLNKNSFFNRFTNEYVNKSSNPTKTYNRFQNNLLFINDIPYSIKKYEVKNAPLSNPQDKYTLSVTIEMDSSTDFNISKMSNQYSFITFDDQYSKQGNHEGTVVLNVSMGRNTNGISESAIMVMDGYYISPTLNIPLTGNNHYVGVCDGLYFGVGKEVANSNSNASVFVSVPEGTDCISVSYDKVKNDELVLYKDYLSKNLTIRSGTMDFSEDVRKIEVSIGEPIVESTTSKGFNTKYDRVKSIVCKLPKVSNSEAISVFSDYPLLLTLNGDENYYGFFVSGEGKLDLEGLNPYKIDENFPVSNEYFKYDTDYVSPMYFYKDQQRHFSNSKTVMLGCSTEEKSFNIQNGDVNITSVNYINNNQVLGKVDFFDIHSMAYGETVIIYTKDTPEKFSVGGTEVDTKKWIGTSKSIFMIGSNNDKTSWGEPNTLKPYGLSQYSLLVFNSAELMTSYYDPIRNIFVILAKCYYDANTPYLGCFIVNAQNLNHKTFPCTLPSDNTEDLPFSYKAPLMDLTKTKKTYLPTENVIETNYTWTSSDTSQNTALSDEFVRIFGPEKVSPLISDYIPDYEFLKGYCMEDGTHIILFATTEGLRTLYSKSGGSRWSLSSNVLAEGALSGVIVEGRLYYLTKCGIEMKFLSSNEIQSYVTAQKGKTDTTSETSNASSKLIWSESIRTQKIDGHVTSKGDVKIFYYDLNSKLKCIKGNNDKWVVHPNF